MSARYAPLPNPHIDPDAIDEMEAAFDDSDDEDAHPQPVNSRNGYQSLPNAEPSSHGQDGYAAPAPGVYDFENADYDYTRPPPGSPPDPSSRALPNEFGNSNGLIPEFTAVRTDATSTRVGWFRRTAASVLPSHYVQRLGLGPPRPEGPLGGGTGNDGVFANVTAKPSRQVRIQEGASYSQLPCSLLMGNSYPFICWSLFPGDDILLVPEEVQKEVPPSYAQAQADAVPPYWETTIHAPSASNTSGDVIIDSLPTGSLFSFLWNMLVSISFQFVGFLLTYLLHTTHAAKLGSRAGLGITLIQYGFAMRDRDNFGGGDVWDSNWKAGDPQPTFGTASEAEAYYNNTAPPPPTPTAPADGGYLVGDATTEWLSFLLMTIGMYPYPCTSFRRA